MREEVFVMRKSLLTVLLAVICTIAAAQQPLNNDAVIKLVKAGLGDDLIVSTINASPGKSDTFYRRPDRD